VIFSELDVHNRPETVLAYRDAVERVIDEMRRRLSEELPLEELAEIACISPYHFLRIFRTLTGLPPCQFLGALRLEKAKRLLLESDRSVTEICLDVGYGSLGSFTSRFTQLVGLSPSRFRQLSHAAGLPSLEELPARLFPLFQGPGGIDVTGPLEASDGLIFIGLFEHAIPQGRPLGCAIATGPGEYHLAAPGDGRFHLFAVGMGWPQGPGEILSDQSAHEVGRAGPVTIRDGQVRGSTALRMRAPDPLDPPLLLTLPLLIAERLAALEAAERAAAERAQAANNIDPRDGVAPSPALAAAAP
jgi:AraC-like DNA-binding protein